MKKLSYANKRFHYGAMPVTKPFMRVLVRQIAKEREQIQSERLNKAFGIVAKQLGW